MSPHPLPVVPGGATHGLHEAGEGIIDVAAEQACDEAAARRVGDRVLVADAILAVERETARMPLRMPGILALSMSQLAIETRVEALLDEPRTAGRLGLVLAALVGSLLVLWSGADSLHHVVESLLSPLLH